MRPFAKMRTHGRAVCLVVGVAAGVACAGKPAPSETTSPAAAAQTLPEGLAYKDMSKEQRGLFMAQKVMPAMKPLFQEFDGQDFAQFTCGTCHGSGVKNQSFAMPDPEIPKLPAPENFMEYAKEPEHARWVTFMAEKVTPAMAQLLQKPQFDPSTNTGEFSCHGCHQVDEPK